LNLEKGRNERESLRREVNYYPGPQGENMQRKSTYETLQADVARIDEKKIAIRILIKKIEENFLTSGLKNEVWLEEKFYEERRADLHLYYYIGYVPAGDPGITVKIVIRNTVTRQFIESKTEMLTSLENGAMFAAACDRIHPLFKEIERIVREHKIKILGINLESLETLASKDLGREPI
jgi:hypothetical protein